MIKLNNIRRLQISLVDRLLLMKKLTEGKNSTDNGRKILTEYRQNNSLVRKGELKFTDLKVKELYVKTKEKSTFL